MHCSVRLCHYNVIPTKACARIPPPPPAFPPTPNPVFRRDLTSSSLLLILTAAHIRPLRAETVTATTTNIPCADPTPTTQAFLDISIDGEPVGKIIIGLYADSVPAGAARFAKLVSGRAGVSYRRKEFVKIMPNYVRHGGLRSYSAADGDSLAAEWEKQNAKCLQGTTRNIVSKRSSVGIIVRDPSKPPPKLKLVARKGKLVIDEEEVGSDPNGTEFVIATKDSPELDSSILVVGRVLDGMDVVERIGQVKTVQENSSSPYFRVAKLIGDKRAVVAERGFNRPYSKVVITNCGLMG